MTVAISVACFAAGAAGGVIAARRPAFGLWWYAVWTIIDTILAALYAAGGRWAWSAVMAASAVITGVSWWQNWRRRKRKNALAAIGAKSRARLAALVAKHRTAQRGTRPVLRPVRESR